MLNHDYNKTYDALNLIEMVNNSFPITSVPTQILIKAISNHTELCLFNQFGYRDNKDFFSLLTRKRIILLCQFIEKYNQKRGDKKTPSASQYNCYYFKKRFNLSKPDWHNGSMINNKIYALEESKDLIENLYCLSNASDETIELAFKELYPQKLIQQSK